MRWLAVIVLLAACSPTSEKTAYVENEAKPPEQSATRSDPAMPAPPSTVPASLVGEYRVAGAGDHDANLDWAMTVSITAERIKLQSQCVTPEWSYEYTDGKIDTKIVPIPICERGYAPVEQAAMEALENATRARILPTQGLVLDKPGGVAITLFSQ